MTRFAVGIVVGLVVTAVGAGHPLGAQESADPAPAASVFPLLQGQWEGQGTLMGRTGAFAMDWNHRGRFATLTFSNAFVGAEGATTPVLTAAALYRTSPTRGDAVWFDSRGVRIEIRWEARDSVLRSRWTAPTEEGRTTYRVLPGDRIEVTDEVAGEEGFRVFARAMYVRAGG